MSFVSFRNMQQEEKKSKDDDIDTDVEFQRKFQRISALKNHNKI